MTDDLLHEKLNRLLQLRRLQAEIKRLETGDGEKKEWKDVARPGQLPPDGDWFVWLILAGRGWGKTRTAAEWAAQKARDHPGCRIALVASTIGDVRDTMVEGDSGLLTCLKVSELRGGSIDGAWNRSLGELYLANGSRFKGYSSEKPWKLRGPQFHFGWADEAAFWADAHKGTATDTTWSNLTIATRLPRKAGWPQRYKTQIVVATTPRPVALLKNTDMALNNSPGLMQRDSTIVTRGRTTDNLENLSDDYRATVVAPLIGTELGRQELDGELLETRKGALWKRDWFDMWRVTHDKVPDLTRIVVGVDPAVSDGEMSDLTGIVVVGADRTGHAYVLADYTMRGTPEKVMQRVARAYHEHEADRVVGEVNNGGDYIGNALKSVDPDIPFTAVRASRGKVTRAEPVSSFYEQGRAHHVGSFPYLEDQMCTWIPADPESPDRMDALVWAFYDLHDLTAGSWKDAYGVVKCGACERMFLGEANGQRRDRCPYCQAPIVEDAA